MASRSSGRLKIGIVLFFLIFFGSSLEAQMTAVIDTSAHKPGGIEGYLMNAVSGKPVEGVAVEVVGSATVGRSGPDGAFRVRNLFPGTHSLRILADGFRPICVAEVAVQPGRTVHLRPIDLRPVSFTGVETLATLYINAKQLVTGTDDYGLGLVPLAQLVVVSRQDPKVEEAAASRPDLDRKDLELLPQKGEDLYRAMARLPGIATSDTSTRFWVRGAPSDQVLIRFDGVDLIEPFHFKGFDGAVSIVDLETLGRMDLLSGALTANYGDHMAGALILETERFDPAQYRNTVGASLTTARAINRGEFASGRGTWLVEGRAGYPGRIIGDAYHNEGKTEKRYSDFFTKIEYRLTPDQSVSFHYLHGDDMLNMSQKDEPYVESGYKSDSVWARWQGKIGRRISGETIFSISSLSWRNREVGSLGGAYSVSLKDHRDLITGTVRQDWTLILSDRALIESGFEYTYGRTAYSYFLARYPTISAINAAFIDPGALLTEKARRKLGQAQGYFLTSRLILTRGLTIEPGIRLDLHDYTGDYNNRSPRINASWVLGRTTLRAGWGIYYQSQSLQQLNIDHPTEFYFPTERAQHRMLSVEHQLRSGIQLRAEIYDRVLSSIQPHWENLVSVDEAFPDIKYIQVLATEGRLSGFARGFELAVGNGNGGSFNWALSYARAMSRENTAFGDWVPRARDQRTTLALDLSCAPSPRWRISASWQYHTGWPTTQAEFIETGAVAGFRSLSLKTGRPSVNRLPAYHRLDLRLTRTIYFDKATMRIFLDVFNVYNRKNIQGYIYNPVFDGDRQVTTKKKAQTQIGLTPNLGIALEF